MLFRIHFVELKSHFIITFYWRGAPRQLVQSKLTISEMQLFGKANTVAERFLCDESTFRRSWVVKTNKIRI